MANPYAPVTVFDADDTGGKGRPGEELAFQDFSNSSIPADNASNSFRNTTSLLPQTDGGATGRIGGPANLFGPDRELQARTGASGWFSIDSYAGYFDVETKMVLERCWKTMFPKDEYFEGVLGGQPDLYGPFWLPTTLIFILFFSSSLSGALHAYLNSYTYNYDFGKLSLAVALVYVYAFALPSSLWAVMTYWAGIEGRTIPEIVNLYGYGLTVFIPVALLSIPPISILRFVLSVVAFVLSLTFLLRNLYPVLASAPSKAARVLVLAIAFCHAIFALVLYFGFLGVGGSVPLEGGGGSGDAVPSLPGDGAGEEVGDVPSPPRWLFV